MGPYWSSCVHMGLGPYRFLWVFMGLYASLWVGVGPYGSIWVLLGSSTVCPYGFLWVFVCPYEFLWVLVLIDLCGSVFEFCSRPINLKILSWQLLP